MPQIIAWLCPHTQKVFASKTEYVAHLRKLAMEHRRQRSINKFQAEVKARIRTTLRTATTTSHIVEWFLDPRNAQFLLETLFRTRYKGITLSNAEKQKFRFETFNLYLHWNDSVLNTHCAPEGKRTNWRRTNDYPTGFPGWKGRLIFQTSNLENIHFSISLFEGTGIHTLFGGGGGGQYSFECSLFTDDWPAMSVWEKLSQ